MSAAPKGRRRNGRASFLAVELEVQAALSLGRTLVAIYDEKRERLGISYAQFARYAKPLRSSLRAAGPMRVGGAMVPVRPVAERRTPPAIGTGPPRGDPAVPILGVDRFAAQALNNKDLF